MTDPTIVCRPRFLAARNYIQGGEVLSCFLQHAAALCALPVEELAITRMKIISEIGKPFCFLPNDAAGASKGDIEVAAGSTRLHFHIVEMDGVLDRETGEHYAMDAHGGATFGETEASCRIDPRLGHRGVIKEAVELVKRLHQRKFDVGGARRRYLASGFEQIHCATPWNDIQGLSAVIGRRAMMAENLYTYTNVFLHGEDGGEMGTFRTQFVGKPQ